MHVRPMLREDLPELGTIAAEAFKSDALFVYLHPHAEAHRDSWRRYVLDRFRDRIVDPASTGLVCVEPGIVSEDGKSALPETILGYAWWHRISTANTPTQRAFTDSSPSVGLIAAFERNVALPLEKVYKQYLYRYLCADYARLAAFRTECAVDEHFAGLPEQWHLDVLGVSPAHQRKGVGQALVEWGMHRGRTENIPVTLEASPTGQFLYRKMGFKCVDRMAFSLTHNIIGGECFIYDPSGVWVREARDGERVMVKCGCNVNVDVVWTEKMKKRVDQGLVEENKGIALRKEGDA